MSTSVNNSISSVTNEECKIPTEQDKKDIAEEFAETGIFSDDESKMLTDMLLKHPDQKGGDCSTVTRPIARGIIIGLGAIIVYVIFGTIKIVRDLLKSNKDAIYEGNIEPIANNISGEEIKQKLQKNNLLGSLKQSFELLIKTVFGRNKEEAINMVRDKGYDEEITQYEKGSFMDSIKPRINKLGKNFSHIIGAIGTFCSATLYNIFNNNEYLKFFLENITTVFKNFWELVIKNFDLYQLLHVTMADIKDGYFKYLNNEQSILMDILNPFEDRICDLLDTIFSKGGKFIKIKRVIRTKKTKRTKLRKKYSKRVKKIIQKRKTIRYESKNNSKK